MRFNLDLYVKFWLLCMPITSFLLLPSIQGTSPALVMSLAIFPFLLLTKNSYKSLFYYKYIFLFFVGYFLLFLLGQLGHLFTRIEFGDLQMVEYGQSKFMRKSFFTQSIYLFCGVSTYSFFRVYYKPSFDKFFILGFVLLAFYGFYESIYYLLFGENGDFISNRIYENGTGRSSSGSLFQLFSFKGISIQRFKSLTGEPSMYAFSVLPIIVYCFYKGKKRSSLFLLISLFLTFSSTAVIGLFIMAIAMINKFKWQILIAFLFLSLAIFFYYDFFEQLVQLLIIEKLSGEGISGQARFGTLFTSIIFFLDANVYTKLFGIGFGYIRSLDLFSSLLVNVGFVGFMGVIRFIFLPILKVKGEYGLKLAILVQFLLALIAVSEFQYLSSWYLLGVVYAKQNE